MTIRECYEKMGSDYDAVLERIPSEAIITKFAKNLLMMQVIVILKML